MELKHTHKALSRLGHLYLPIVKRKMEEEGLIASGALSNSMNYEVVNNALEISMLRHGGAVEGGSSPSSKSPSKDFVYRIIEWARYKGMRPNVRDSKGRFKKLTSTSYKKMGWAIAKGILERGTIKRYNYQGSRIFSETYEELIPKFGEDILEAYGFDIENELRIILKIER